MRVSDPGELIAAVPALLGFPPENSIVAILIGGESGSSLGAVMRHDLIRPSPRELAIGIPADAMLAGLEQFVAVADRECARAVIVVFVDDRPELDAAADDIADVLGDMLAEVGTDLGAVHAVGTLARGERWWSLLGDPRSGRLPDPVSSAVAAAHVFEGRRIRGSRGELEELIERGPLAQRRRIAGLIDRSATEPADIAGRRRLLDDVLWHVANVASGALPEDPEIARLGSALQCESVRTCLLALPLSDSRDAAEQLWITLARSLPDPLRSQPAMLLGYSAYLRGDGPLAGIAFAAALESDPKNSLARLLDSSLQFGLRPEMVREIAQDGVASARALGLDLDPTGE